MNSISTKLIELADSIESMDMESAKRKIMSISSDAADIEFELMSFHNGMSGSCPACNNVSMANRNLASMLDEEQIRYYNLFEECEKLKREICEMLSSDAGRQSTPAEEARSRGWHKIYELNIKDQG